MYRFFVDQFDENGADLQQTVSAISQQSLS